MTATYSPEDNKLRLYPDARLDAEEFARVKAAGFRWAPAQKLFVAPMWTPERVALLEEMTGGEIGDEDTSLVDRAEERAERFDDYSSNRMDDAENARRAVSAIADNIPFGQPILVGHHSEKHARRDAEKIENGMRKAVKMWQCSQYWTQRAKGALRHAKYKERPDVRARRIKTIEADKRKVERSLTDATSRIGSWWNVLRVVGEGRDARPLAAQVANYSAHYSNAEPWGVWSALNDGTADVEDTACEMILANDRSAEHCREWLAHYENRLAYERAMLEEAGGTAADKVGPQKGGGCKCWASPRGGFSYIQKVNKVSVTVLDNWGNPNDKDGGRNFTRNIPFDKLFEILSAAEVAAARAEGRLIESGDKTGFALLDAVPRPQTPPEPSTDEHGRTVYADPPAVILAAYSGPEPEPEPEPQLETAPAVSEPAGDPFEAMRESLKSGVRVVSAPQLFPTPPELAERLIELAGISCGNRVLEPSAGTGALLDALEELEGAHSIGASVTAVEINQQLVSTLARRFPDVSLLCADFLSLNGELGTFDRIVMNPPFANGDDIRHIQHARTKLAPGGRLVAICANGPRQRAKLMPEADSWIDLPAGSFAAAGTNVNAAIVTFTA